MSSLSSSFIENFNTKLEAYRLIHDPTRLKSLLFSKYGEIEDDFNFFYINQLIYNLPTKLNCHFKEIKYTNLIHDYLKRLYKKKESFDRIPKLSDYYKNYHLFFCRPTFRNQKLGKIMSNFQDKKAEIFYKNNYKDSREKMTMEKEENNIKNNNSSFSLSSFDNITNNKIIFDKQTKKMLDKSETESKNNNYYNTLNLESSRSNLLLNNGLISKRTEDNNSFEKCIHALIDYQFNKNKNKNKKINRRSNFKNRKIKNIIINNSNMNKTGKMKNIMSQSQRESYKFYNFNIYNNNSKILNYKANKINSTNNSNSNNYINKIIKTKKKKRSVHVLTNNRYNTSTTTLLNSKNIKKINNVKEFNLNIPPSTTTNKDINKNRIYIYSNNNTINNIRNNSKNNSNVTSKIFYNSNYETNPNSNKKNIKSREENKNHLKNFSKLSEYLNQIRGKDNNFTQVNSLHRKNCLSIGEEGNRNLFFNLTNKNRITKKKMTINKNLKITITNGNINPKTYKSLHTKNKTFDYNSISQTNNNLTKHSNYNNNNLVINEEFNTLLNKKPKKTVYKINIDDKNNCLKNNKNKYSKINKTIKNKNPLINYSSRKKFNKISVTQNTSKEKNTRKDLTVKIFSPNLKKKDIDYHKGISSPYHKKNNKSVVANTCNTNKELLVKSNKITKTNFCLSPNTGINKNVNINDNILTNLGNNISPTNKLFNSIVYFKRNIVHNSSENSNNNIYIKKSINKDIKMIKKNDNNNLLNSCHFSNTTSKELYTNYTLPNNNSNKNMEIKKLSRNNKKISKKNFDNSKKSNIHNKTNSSLNKNQLNNNYIINDNNNLNNDNLNTDIINNTGNINISIKKSNINIKDSILHIDKIYIKKENSNKREKAYEMDEGFQNKKVIEMKVRDEIMKTVGNNFQINQEKINSMKYSPLKINFSPKVINVHRNYNLINKNNKEINKYK